jgi:hypothetical protein
MAYQATVGQLATVRHVVRNLAGSGVVSGQQALITATLVDPAGVASALPVAIAEVGASGYYNASFTPTTAGTWILSLTNPAGTDGATLDYHLVATVGQTLTAPGTNDLTTLGRVRERLQFPATITQFDGLLATLITEVSNSFLDLMGPRTVKETQHTHYLNGSGTPALILPEGPLVSVASVHLVEYQNDGAGGRQEVLTVVPPYDRLEGGLRSEGHLGRGRIELLGGVWAVGRRNVKVVHTCGWAVVPEKLVSLTTTAVITKWLTRETDGLASKVMADFQQNLLSPRQLQDSIDRELQPYMLEPVFA